MARKKYKLSTLPEITATIEKVVDDVSKGKMETNIANVIFRGIDVELKALKLLDIEKRIEDIEDMLEAKNEY